MIYSCSTYYDPERESGFRFDDPEVGIALAGGIELQTSERDRQAPLCSSSRVLARAARARDALAAPSA